MSFPPHSPIIRRRLWTLAALAVWALALARGFDVFGPGSDINNVSFNSDSAIPVLMANDPRPITIFNFYYYGADRWGGWALVLCQLVNRATGFQWTPESLTILQTVWVFLGVLVFASLDRDDWPIAGLAYLAVLCLHRESRYLLFEMSQLYGWQVTAMLLGWVGVRQLFDSFLRAPRPYHAVRRVGWLAVAFGASYLAVWSSAVSTVCLIFLLAIELLRARLRAAARWIDRRVILPGALGVVAIAGATLIERAQKLRYNEYSLQHYGYPFSTTFTIDTEYLGQNLARQWQHLATMSSWPLYALATLALLGLLVAWAYAALGRRTALRARLAAWMDDDTAILVIASYGVAAINVALAVLVSHVRENDYDTRYLTITNLCLPIGGLLTIYLLLTHVLRRPGATALVKPALLKPVSLAAGALLLVVTFPQARDMPEYRQLRRTAQTLASRAPNGVLMGGYWDTYVFTALQPHDPMIAVPFEGEHHRTPWTPASIARATEIIVAYPRKPWQPPPTPPETLVQHGNSLKLANARWFEDQAYAFALYVHDTHPSN